MPKLDVDGVGLAYDDVGRRDEVPLVPPTPTGT